MVTEVVVPRAKRNEPCPLEADGSFSTLRCTAQFPAKGPGKDDLPTFPQTETNERRLKRYRQTGRAGSNAATQHRNGDADELVLFDDISIISPLPGTPWPPSSGAGKGVLFGSSVSADNDKLIRVCSRPILPPCGDGGCAAQCYRLWRIKRVSSADGRKHDQPLIGSL